MTGKPLALGAASLAAAAFAAVLIAGGPGPAIHQAEASTHGSSHGVERSPQAAELRSDMRRLWEDHIVWTRQFIVSAVADLADVETAAGRLLANQDDIGDAIKPYYGEAAGEQLSALLRDHILIAADLVSAAKSGDQAAFESANSRWSDNANDIAGFLNAANPRNWDRDEMRAMMADHLALTLAEASARLSQDWEADVAAYDSIHEQILHMADMLASGIIKQFPGRF